MFQMRVWGVSGDNLFWRRLNQYLSNHHGPQSSDCSPNTNEHKTRSHSSQKLVLSPSDTFVPPALNLATHHPSLGCRAYRSKRIMPKEKSTPGLEEIFSLPIQQLGRPREACDNQSLLDLRFQGFVLTQQVTAAMIVPRHGPSEPPLGPPRVLCFNESRSGTRSTTTKVTKILARKFDYSKRRSDEVALETVNLHGESVLWGPYLCSMS